MHDASVRPNVNALPDGFGVRRPPVRIAPEALTRSYLLSDRALPLVVEGTVETVRLADWLSANRSAIRGDLRQHGAVLFRGFGVTSPAGLEEVISAISPGLLEYTYRSTPRSQVSGRIYTSTAYPADQSIPWHNELSYASSWPTMIFFCCVQPADTGGDTPIADSRRVYARIDPVIRERFTQGGVTYVRNYSDVVDLPWAEVFQTIDRAEVERMCLERGIALEWRGGSGLRTRQTCQAVTRHPLTGEAVWFNQAHLFHPSSLPAGVRQSLESAFSPEDLPRNAFYGDGTPIDDASLDAVRLAYAAEEARFTWQRGDVLMVDNVLVAHGRAPFAGPRRIIVGMSEPSDTAPNGGN